MLALTCDVRDPGAVESAFNEVARAFGGMDVLVNNAGVGVGAPIADMSHDEWGRIIGTNLTGVFHCCKAAIPHLRARGGGWIISVSSLASKNPFAGGAAYCASKAGLNAFSEALMQELRYDNIRVSYVLPGSVATGFSGRAALAPAPTGSCSRTTWRTRSLDLLRIPRAASRAASRFVRRGRRSR